MVLIIFILISRFILSSPSLYGGGCTILDDHIYYVGGMISPNLSLSDFTYQLNLQSNFQVQNGTAPWKKVNVSGLNPVMFPGVVNHQKELYVLGMNVPLSTGMQIYNGNWNLKPLETSGQIVSLVGGSINSYSNLIYSGLAKLQDNSEIGVVGIFDMTWKWYPGAELASHTATIYKDKLILIGGYIPSQGIFQSMTSILTMDLNTRQWEVKSTTGFKPQNRFGHSSTLIENNLYIIGGATNLDVTNFPSDDVITLDLDTFHYSRNRVPGFKGAFAGCLTHLNQTLIYAFGYKNQFLLNSTQFINNNELLLGWSGTDTNLPIKISMKTAITVVIIGNIALVVIVLGIIYLILRLQKVSEAEFRGSTTTNPALVPLTRPSMVPRIESQVCSFTTASLGHPSTMNSIDSDSEY